MYELEKKKKTSCLHPYKYITISEASAEIAGGPERYVQEGSSVVLTCTLRQHTQAPEYVFWYHNRAMINFDTNRQVRQV